MKRVYYILTGALLSATPALGAPSPAAGASLLEQSSKAFTQIAKQATPATVYIKCQITPPAAAEQEAGRNPLQFHDEFFRHFFGGNPFLPQQQQPQATSGSGFVITEDGYVVTNFHVVKDATQITVIFNDGREYAAVLSGNDASTDLAVLKIDEENLPHLSFGDSDELEIGEWVVAIGTPFELDSSLTVGVVSAKGRQGLGLSPYEDYIQTDAAINPGNSGGPLLNLQGEVIGINTAIFSRSGGNVGIGFAIPSKMAQSVISQIKDNGIVKRGYLGIVLQPIDKDLADAFGLDKQEGLLVAEVMKDSPASKGGLQQGDIIVQSNRAGVKNVQKFRNDVALMNPGESIQLNILRDGAPLNLTIQLGSQNNAELATAEMTQKLGIEVDTLTPDLAAKLGYPAEMSGVVITKVKPNSPAAQAGLRPMHVILSVATNLSQQKRVSNLTDFEEAVQEISDTKKNHLILVVRQQNLQRYYTIRMN